MTNREYQEHPALSRSQLQQIAKSPLHYKYALANKDSSDALAFGSAYHKWILEADDFFNEFAIAPNVDRRTKEGKAVYDEFIEINSDKEIITQSDFDTIQEMRNELLRDGLVVELLEGVHEQPFFWTDSTTGIACKCKPDVISNKKIDGLTVIADLKTTEDASERGFYRSVKKYGYKLQAGMYTEGLFENTCEEYTFAFIAQEKKPPYAHLIHLCTPEFIKEGRDEFRSYIGTLKYCMDNNTWFGYEGISGGYAELRGEDE